MKKILLAAIFFGSSFYSFAQTQIPNGDFENWSDAHHCTTEDSLNHFFTIAAANYLSTYINFQDGNCPDAESENKSTNAQSGSYALRLAPLMYDNTPFYNRVDLGNMKLTYFPRNPLAQIIAEGIAFTDRPTKLTGYYQFTLGAATDQLAIDVWAINANDDFVFTGSFNTSSEQTTYQKFELLLDYTSSDPIVKLYVRISAGNIDAGSVSIHANTVALIDNLVFEYDDVTTSTTNYHSTSAINIFASNKTINFSENVSDVHIVDMVGASKMQEAGTTKTLNAASLTTGMYIVTYKYNDAYFSKKVVIE